MTENEHTNEAEQASPTAAPPAADSAAEAIDGDAFLAQAMSQPVHEAAAALSTLLAEHGQAALPALVLVAQKAGLELAAQAMDMLAGLRSEEAANALAPLGADRSDAARAKQARRALHKLSLSGVRPAPVSPAARSEPEPDKVYACLASPIDGEGTCTVTIARQNRFGTLSMASFMLNEDLGVLDVVGAIPCSMSLWKRYLADAQRTAAGLVPVELAFGQRQIEIAAARNERSKTPLPQRYYMYASLAMGPSEERQRPPELQAEAIQANPDLLANSARLFHLPECKTWLLPTDEMRPHVLRMMADARRVERSLAEQPDMPVLDLGRLQHQGTLISMAASALFDGARRALYEARLTYTADLLWRADRMEEAQWAMAAALALAPESTLPVGQHPFVHEVVSVSVLLTAEQEHLGEQPQGAGGAPAAASEKAAEPDEYVDADGFIRRKSGLILPR